MRSAIAAALITLLAVPVIATGIGLTAPADDRSCTGCGEVPLRCLGAAAGGLAGSLIGIVGTVAISDAFGHPVDDDLTLVATVGGLCYPLGCAAATWLMALPDHPRGSAWGAVVGAAVGAIPAVYAVTRPATDDLDKTLDNATWFAVGAIASPVGAVLVYSLTRSQYSEYGWLEQRLDVPRMAMTISHDEFNQPVAGVKCDFLAARF